jgi:hypothetical protein
MTRRRLLASLAALAGPIAPPLVSCCLLAAGCVLAAGCGNQEPEAAQALWDRLQTTSYRSTLSRAPGWETRKASTGVHGADVDLYVNSIVSQVFFVGERITGWPLDSMIVKDAWNGSDLKVVAAMEKRADGWFWAEWDKDGNSLYSGNPGACAGCHKTGDDFVRAFRFPGVK